MLCFFNKRIYKDIKKTYYAMFDLTDDVENSPNTTRKVKPAEVKPFVKPQIQKKEVPKNDDINSYDYSDDSKGYDDKEW